MLSVLHLVSSALGSSLVEYKVNFLAFWPPWSYHLAVFRHLIEGTLSYVLLMLLVSNHWQIFWSNSVGCSIVSSEALWARYDLLLLLALLDEVIRGEHLLTLVDKQRHVFAILTLSLLLLHLLLLTIAVVVTVAESALSFLRALVNIVHRCRAILTRWESHRLITKLIGVVVGHRLMGCSGIGEETVHWVLVWCHI